MTCSEPSIGGKDGISGGASPGCETADA